MDQLMISSSGLRGIVGTHITPSVIEPFIRAFLNQLPPGVVIIGGDTRTSYDAVSQLVSALCQLCGRDVVIIGRVPTPTVQQMVRRYAAAGGVAITASHNPIAWNGIKLIDSSGSFLSRPAFADFLAHYTNHHYAPYVDYAHQGTRIVDDNALAYHVDRIRSVLPLETIAPLRVLIDVNHGTGRYADPVLFSHIPQVTVDYLYDGPDGAFSHSPEPVTEHLNELCQRMASGSYDIGFAQDPDADRLVIVDETGRFIGEDYSLAFCMDYYLSITTEEPQQVVVNMSTSQIIQWLANHYGARYHETRVGEPNVTAAIKDLNATVGGEGNGGIIVPAIGWGRDSLTGIALALLHCSSREESVSQIVRRYPQYTLIREKQPLSSATAVSDKLQRVQQHFANASLSLDDGVKVRLDDGWIHIRPSNTEPIIRLFAEAPTPEKAHDLIQTVLAL
jgi:phosphomannomutase